MTNLKKLMAVLLAMTMILALGVSAFADGEGTGEGAGGEGGNEGGNAATNATASITINRDSSWDSTAESANATYTYYKIFDAVITSAAGVDVSTGALTGNGVVVYTVDTEAKANALPNIFKADLAADGLYYVTLANSSTSAADIVAALKTMVAANPTLFPGTSETSNANPVVLNVGSDGYYLIEASNGKDAAVQTIGSVTINEKNDYPTIDKKQKKANGTYADTALPAEIGSYIDYQVTVHIPADATKQIAVIDKMSAGLDWDTTFGTDGLTVTPAIAYSALVEGDTGYNADATWQIKFAESVVQANRNTDIVITYRAKVTAAAITDSGKENEVTLNYDNGNYVLKDDVDYEIYFAGIYKVDKTDATADMSGVKFVLKDGSGSAVNVTYDSTNGYYVVDPASTSNEVETRAETVTAGEGESATTTTYYTIKIRGLDNDKTYTLTETETKTGYNLLNGDVTLTLFKDEINDAGIAFANTLPNAFDRVENGKGTELPSTGGIGTTIFYVVGGLLAVGAGVVLVTRRKVGDED